MNNLLNKRLKTAIAIFAILGLASCGGGGGGNNTPTEQGYTALQTTAALQSGVQVIDQQNISVWKIISRQAASEDAPATIFEVPNTVDVQIGSIYVVDQMAYKVTSVAAATQTTKFVYVSQPEISEIFSTLKLKGDLPITKMELTGSALQTGLQQVGVIKTDASWTNTAQFLKPIESKDYDPASLAELGAGCLKIETDQGDFDDAGQKIKPLGFKIYLDCAEIKSSDGIMSSNLLLTGGIYPKLNFKDGFDLTNPDTYDGNFQHTFYTKISGGVTATAKIQKLFRLISVKSRITIFVPTPAGVPIPVILTIWTPLDLILQAEAGGAESGITWDMQGKYVVDSRGGQWTSLKQPSWLPNEKANFSASVLLRPGIGLGVYGLIPFSFHPKGGVKGEIEADLTLNCSKASLKLVWGADIVFLPNTWIQIGSDPWEKKHTKELLVLIDAMELANQPIGNANGCNKPMANITQLDATLTPPQISRNLNDGEIRMDSRWLNFGGVQLSGGGSLFADTFEWRIENDFGQSAVLGNSPSINLSQLDLWKIPLPTRITLVVSNGGLEKRTSKAVVSLVANKAPFAAGTLVRNGEAFILTSSASDVDGRITQIQWTDSVTDKVITTQTSNGEINIPLASIQTSANTGPVILKLKVWDNDGAVAEHLVEELKPTVTSISPLTAFLNTATNFTVTGSNLPSTAAMAMADAICETPTNRTSNGFNVSCVPQGTATGSKTITIKDAPGGNVIDAGYIVNVTGGVTAGLVAYYCFDDPANIGKDCSANSNNGTATGGVSAVTGVQGSGAMFGGYNNPGVIHVPNSASLQFGPTYSHSFFIKVDSPAGMDGWGNLAANGGFTTVAKSHDRVGMCWGVGIDASNNLVSGGPGSFDSVSMTAGTDVLNGWASGAIGRWIHVVNVVDSVGAKTYLDGRLAWSQSGTVNFTIANTQDLFIGKFSDYWYPLNGTLDELKIFNRALSDEEVLVLYTAGGTH